MRESNLKLVEDLVEENLSRIFYDKYSDEDERRRLFNECLSLIDKVNQEEKMNYEYFDKEDRRKIEREKSESMERIEKMKSGVTIPRAILEITKTMGPIVAYILAYSVFQRRLFIYEGSNGRLTSTAGKELHLPRFSPK